MCRGSRLKLVSTTLRKPNPSRTLTSISITLGKPQVHPISTRPGPHPLTICQLLPLICSLALTIKSEIITHPFSYQDHRYMSVYHPTELGVRICNHCGAPPLCNLCFSTGDNINPRTSNCKFTQVTMQHIDVAKHHFTTKEGPSREDLC